MQFMDSVKLGASNTNTRSKYEVQNLLFAISVCVYTKYTNIYQHYSLCLKTIY